MTNDRHRPASPTPSDEPAIDPDAADRAVRSGTFDTAGYGEDYAAVETDASLEEVEAAWEAAQADVDQTDLRLMEPADRLEHGRQPREGE